jgi:hypothetical protein
MSRFSSLPLAFVAFVGAELLLEREAGRSGGRALGVLTWLVLLAACRRLDRDERRRVAALVAVATAGEVLGSLVLELYAYRHGGIPAFVPPGHGLVYLAGRRLSRAQRPRLLVAAALAFTVAWGAARLLADAPPDTAGILAAIGLAAVVLRSRRATLFAAMVLVVDGLELYGTALGTWHWVTTWPGLGLSIGNPPLGAALGYVAFDWLELRLTRPSASRTASCQPARWAMRSSAPSPAST